MNKMLYCFAYGHDSCGIGMGVNVKYHDLVDHTLRSFVKVTPIGYKTIPASVNDKTE